MFSLKTICIAAALVISVCLTTLTNGVPAIGHRNFGKRLDVDEYTQICLNNCVQCKQMFGDYFRGQKCGETCVKYKGKSIPDCEDIGSIAPFLNTFGYS